MGMHPISGDETITLRSTAMQDACSDGIKLQISLLGDKLLASKHAAVVGRYLKDYRKFITCEIILFTMSLFLVGIGIVANDSWPWFMNVGLGLFSLFRTVWLNVNKKQGSILNMLILCLSLISLYAGIKTLEHEHAGLHHVPPAVTQYDGATRR
jgi:hypothetical protein